MTETTIQMRVMFALEHIALSLFAEAIKTPNTARQVLHGRECFMCAPMIQEQPVVPEHVAEQHHQLTKTRKSK